MSDRLDCNQGGESRHDIAQMIFQYPVSDRLDCNKGFIPHTSTPIDTFSILCRIVWIVTQPAWCGEYTSDALMGRQTRLESFLWLPSYLLPALLEPAIMCWVANVFLLSQWPDLRLNAQGD